MIRLYCWEFLDAMTKAVAELRDLSNCPWSIYWRDFPEGACGDTSELFAIYLHEMRGVERERIEVAMLGRRSDGRTHAWNFIDGFYVDLTPGQFPGQPDLIIRRNSRWHEQFLGYVRRSYVQAIGSLGGVADRHRLMLDLLMKHHSLICPTSYE